MVHDPGLRNLLGIWSRRIWWGEQKGEVWGNARSRFILPMHLTRSEKQQKPTCGCHELSLMNETKLYTTLFASSSLLNPQLAVLATSNNFYVCFSGKIPSKFTWIPIHASSGSFRFEEFPDDVSWSHGSPGPKMRGKRIHPQQFHSASRLTRGTQTNNAKPQNQKTNWSHRSTGCWELRNYEVFLCGPL